MTRKVLRTVTIPVESEVASTLESKLTHLCLSNDRTPRFCEGLVRSARRAAIFRSPQRFVLGLGQAAVFNPAADAVVFARAVSSALERIDSDDPIGRPASAPIALGALPFELSSSFGAYPSNRRELSDLSSRSPHAAHSERTSERVAGLFVPELTLVRNQDGSSWITLTGDGDFSSARRQIEQLLSAGGDEVASERADLSEEEWRTDDGSAQTEDLEREDYLEAVEVALGEISAERIWKVVLARKVKVTFERDLHLGRVLDVLRKYERTSRLFAVRNGDCAFSGASPELLIERDGDAITSLPLAGTVRMTGDRSVDHRSLQRMASSTKENFEHRLVVEAVTRELRRWCDSVDVPDEPVLMPLRQLAHLATPVSGVLDPARWAGSGRKDLDFPSALELAALLHPTPAVAGAPTGPALELIRKLEPHGRGLYAGPVGWVDSAGNGEFVLGIRSAEISRNVATVRAGAGIVAGSDPGAELMETDVKLETMLDVIRYA